MSLRTPLLATGCLALLATGLLAGCSRKGDLVDIEGVGVTAARSNCPSVGIPDFTGDITLFGADGRQTADNIDISASMTDVRSHCDETDDKVIATVNFNVYARRTNVQEARSVNLPYFVTVTHATGGVVAKRIGNVALQFAPGQARAEGHATGSAYIDRAAATLPEDIRRQITRRRRPGDTDAALDPMVDPKVKAAVDRATFEVLVGFQLSERQLAYNATR